MEDTSICDEIIEFHKKQVELGMGGEGKVKKSDQTTKTVDHSYKSSIDTVLQYDMELCHRYFNNVLDFCLQNYIKKYEFSNLQKSGVTEGVSVQHYTPPIGGFPAWHCERMSQGTNDRHLVFMTYLNDVTDSGTTDFFYQCERIKPEKGLTLIWPVSWTHTHRGFPSPTQEKWITTGWVTFDYRDL